MINTDFRIEELMKKIVDIESDTGTILERNIENYMYEWFSNLEYFKKNNKYFGQYTIEGDSLSRNIVWALVKGNSNNTFILLNHHDVVDSFDYGDLRKYAYNPEKLKKKLLDMDLNADVIKDLNDDDWLFGRGTADMKAGIAIHMMLIKEYAEKKNIEGNILFVSVPDEENLSIGMRNVPFLLEKLQSRFSLKYKLVINSEPHNRENKNEFIYYDGSVGKVMMSIYVKGKKTHMGEIFEGLNPSYVLSKIVEKTEMNTYFSDYVDGLATPPPAWGFVRDFKERYDVSLPEAAGGYINFLTIKRTPDNIIKDLKDICMCACDDVLAKINNNYKKHYKNNDLEYPIKIRVLTYHELVQEAKDFDEKTTVNEIIKTKKEISKLLKTGKITLVESNFKLIKTLLEIIPNKNPIVVLSLSPPYYPHISKENIKNKDEYINNLDNILNEYIKDYIGLQCRNKKIFMGISDLSYFDFQGRDEAIDYVIDNMPLWGELYSIPFEQIKKLSIPVLNIGPWGKDIHKISERVNRIDLNNIIPKIIKHIIDFS